MIKYAVIMGFRLGLQNQINGNGDYVIGMPLFSEGLVLFFVWFDSLNKYVLDSVLVAGV